jgi:two-component system NtrC family sensor kinase
LPSIHVIQGPDQGRRVDLLGEGVTVGRQDADIELSDSTVSRNHFMFRQRGGAWMLEDLGSANGTLLNGTPVTKAVPVNPGDQIRCGQTLIVFTHAAAGAPAQGAPASGPAGAGVDIDEDGHLVDAAIVATLPSNQDSVVIPTPEAGAQAIGNLRIIYELFQEIGGLFDVDAVIEKTMDKVFQVVQADRGFIMLKEESDDAEPQLTLRASRFAREDEATEIPVSKTIIREVFRHQVGVLSSNAMSDRRFSAGKSVQNFSIHSAICVPIKGHDDILGVIHLDSSVSERTYSTEQLRLLTAIGYQTGLTIENVRLYESKMQSERLAAVGETVAVISHHAKNILQALSAGIDVVDMALKAENLEKIKTAWPMVQRGLTRTNGLILDMLAFSKDRQPLREELDVNDLLTDCVDLIAHVADERHVAVMTDLADLPPLHADADGLLHAFLNLMNNALHAVEDNTGVLTIRTTYETLEREILVRIIDNGCGIEPQRMHEIFQPFSSGKGQQGTGLGLAVARKLFKEHGGDISVESAVGEGTTFTIVLPLISVGKMGDD